MTNQLGQFLHRWRVLGILIVASLPRLWVAIFDQGIFWPDEIFQSLEQAHRFAFGYGFVPWEFQEGARSWLFPGSVGLLWKVLSAFGVTGAPALVISTKVLMVTVALLGIYAALRLAERLAGVEALLLCGAVAAAFPPSLVYGSRCMAEMLSGPLLVWVALLSLDSSKRKLLLAGALLGIAIYLRYQNGLLALGLLVSLLVAKRKQSALQCGAGIVGVAVLGSALDWATWGSPLHSLVTYVRFNLLEGGSATFGVEPVTYYFSVLFSAVGVSSLLLGVGLWQATKRAAPLVIISLGFVLIHSLVDHKELRFIMPVVPLLLALSSVGLADLIDRFFTRPAVTAVDTQSQGSKRHKEWRNKQPATASKAEVRNAQQALTVAHISSPTWVVAALLMAVMGWRAAKATFDDFGQRTGGPLSGEPMAALTL